MTRLIQICVAVTLILPLAVARAADLVVWWEEGQAAEEDAAVREIIAAFEQNNGKKVELVLGPQEELVADLMATLEAGERIPDFVFTVVDPQPYERWAYEGRLVNLSDAVGHFSDLFDPDALQRVTLLDGTTGRRGLYLLPMGLSTYHVHVWKSLLERAGFTLADIPKEWDAFWAFWCDQAQPAVRKALGRDVWGIGLPMAAASIDTQNGIWQFIHAYEGDYVTPDGRLVIDDAEIRRKLIAAIDDYTAIYRKGCTPPDSVSWDTYTNNERFLNQAIVMTPNETLSIPNALKGDRPKDYYERVATIEWPFGPDGEPFPIGGTTFSAVVFKDGRNPSGAKEFVRFLVAEGWLDHYLDFSGERLLPSLTGLLDQPFWLDPSDPHRMASVMQAASRPLAHNYAAASGDGGHDRVARENVWGKAINRVAAEGISPEQAVDEAIARIKQILSE